MRIIPNSLRGRILVVLIVSVTISHIAGLWLYAERSNASTTLLHDALLAERIALISKLVEKAPPSDVSELLTLVSSPVVGFSQTNDVADAEEPPEGSRPHTLEHLLSVFLNEPTHDGIRMSFSPTDEIAGTKGLLATINGSAHTEVDHLPSKPLAEIRSVGRAAVQIKLRDGTWLDATAPLLGVEPYSIWKLGTSLAVMLVAILPLGLWVLNRSTQPLTVLASAAERLGTDIHASPLAEMGPLEIRTTAHAFNVMQERIRGLVQDRMEIAAAIAHDLGTPVTRLRLRAEEIADEDTRQSILADLNQMARMITETLAFSRLDFEAEAPEPTDLTALVERVCDDLVDVGGDVAVSGPPHVVVRTKPLALRRAITNLVENAVKYGKRAQVMILDTRKSVELIVEDDGPGIPEALQTAVFEPFRRLPQGDYEIDGTGLGLTAARSLVRSLGGEVTLSNRSEGGLRAIIRLLKS
ncbi:MAG: ATP-binding protein [Hyphomicrobiaceae bacterium]